MLRADFSGFCPSLAHGVKTRGPDQHLPDINASYPVIVAGCSAFFPPRLPNHLLHAAAVSLGADPSLSLNVPPLLSVSHSLSLSESPPAILQQPINNTSNLPGSSPSIMEQQTILENSISQGAVLMGPAGTIDYAEWEADFDNDGSWEYELGDGLTHDEHPSRSNSNDGDMSVNGDISNQNNNKMEGEKRKEPPEGDESVDPHDIDPKRRDDKENKIAKKPGRKPLTSEPTSKRKAQNRAAQRAFRERKEKHLKDLEQKVDDLEKASESANHENSMLRAQVDRLQTELREYKRRLHTTEINRSTASLASLGNFHFDFPLFGGDGVFGNKDKKNYKLSLSSGRIDKQQTLPSPNNGDVTSGSSKSLQSPLGLASSSLADLFSPSILDTVNKSAGQDYMDSLDTSSIQSTPKLNGGYDVNSSPSASSVSQHGPGSSRGTTPKNVGPSPRPNDMMMPICEENLGVSVIDKDYVCKSGGLDGETETTFCEKLGMACGNPNNPIPKVPQFSTASETTTNSLDWLAQQSSNNTFDPVIFNDYRDPINDINSSINMSFFDDAFPITNFDLLGAPITTEGNQQPQSQPQSIHQQQRLPQPLPRKDLLAEIDAINNSDDEFVPGDDPKKMLSCNKIWDRISSHPRFVSGELDMDGLCSELRSKAKCSESGVVVSENDVQEVLGKVAPSDDLFSTVCPKSRGLV